MSRRSRLFRDHPERFHLDDEPGAGTVQPNPCCCRRAAERVRELGRAESFPGHQHEQLAIVVTEPAECEGCQQSVGANVQWAYDILQLDANPLGELGAPTLPPPMVGENSSTRRIQP